MQTHPKTQIMKEEFSIIICRKTPENTIDLFYLPLYSHWTEEGVFCSFAWLWFMWFAMKATDMSTVWSPWSFPSFLYWLSEGLFYCRWDLWVLSSSFSLRVRSMTPLSYTASEIVPIPPSVQNEAGCVGRSFPTNYTSPPLPSPKIRGRTKDKQQENDQRGFLKVESSVDEFTMLSYARA